MDFTLLNKKFTIDKKLENYITLYKQFEPLKKVASDNLYNYIENYKNYENFPNDIESTFKNLLEPTFLLCIKICTNFKISNLTSELIFNISYRSNNFEEFYTLYNEIVQAKESIIRGSSAENSITDDNIDKIKHYFSNAIRSDDLATKFKNSISISIENVFKTLVYVILVNKKITFFNFQLKNDETTLHKLLNGYLEQDAEITAIVNLLQGNPFNKQIYSYVLVKYPHCLNELSNISNFFGVDVNNLIQSKKDSNTIVNLSNELRTKILSYYKELPKTTYYDCKDSKKDFLNFIQSENIDKNIGFIKYILNDIDKKSIDLKPDDVEDFELEGLMIASESDVENFYKKLTVNSVTEIEKSIESFKEFCFTYNVDKNISDKYTAELKRKHYETKRNIYNNLNK